MTLTLESSEQMKLPFVSREAWESAERRYDALMDKYHEQGKLIAELRRDGFQAKAPPIARDRREVPGTPDIDEIAQSGAKKEFIERFSKDLQGTGIPKATADQEAGRVAAEMYDMYGGDQS
jgi:hypothetical protein